MQIRVDAEGRVVPVRNGEVVIGRSGYCTLPLQHYSVSRLHAVIRRVRDGFEIADLGSRNGTFVNGERIDGARLVRSGDDVRVGDQRLTLEPATESSVAVTPRPGPPPPSMATREMPIGPAGGARPPDDLAQIALGTRARERG